MEKKTVIEPGSLVTVVSNKHTKNSVYKWNDRMDQLLNRTVVVVSIHSYNSTTGVYIISVPSIGSVPQRRWYLHSHDVIVEDYPESSLIQRLSHTITGSPFLSNKEKESLINSIDKDWR